MSSSVADEIVLGVVAIGRNEGDRLRQCLHSVQRAGVPAVYVDSGSSDGSVALADDMGFALVELDAAQPFTAARARHAGFERLVALFPNVRYVMFVDGDCEIVDGWTGTAVSFFNAHEHAGAVCGRRRERCPGRSIYNRLCDLEWDTPPGQALSCGGDFVIRVSSYRQAGGFDPSVPAGEEPELCYRLRRDGWSIWRLGEEMTLHDAAMTNFWQWWKRQLRTGYGGRDVESRFKIGIFHRLLRSAVFWGAAFPLGILGLAIVLGMTCGLPAAAVTILLGLCVWLLQLMRIFFRYLRGGLSATGAMSCAVFTLLSKWPIFLGQFVYWSDRLRGGNARLIEYKHPANR